MVPLGVKDFAKARTCEDKQADRRDCEGIQDEAAVILFGACFDFGLLSSAK